jgi:exopolysaccharide production protein ExoZ
VRDHIYPLDVLRFFAALCVAAYHLGFYGWASHYSSTSIMLNGAARYEALAPFTWFGWVGVEIFFVISGFVIANSAHGRTPSAFLKGRLIRLYPAAWVCATITLLAWIVLAQTPAQQMISPYLHSITLWLRGPWIDGVYWSLAIEIVFYALVFGTLVANRIVSIAMLPWLLTALSLVYLVLVATDAGASNAAAHWALQRADLLLLRFGAFFAVGIWLWLLSQQKMTPLRYLGLAVAIACCFGEIAKRVQESASGEVDFAMAMPFWAPALAWTIGLAICVVAARNPEVFNVRSPRLQTAFKRIGLMTYPMFLVHNILGAGLIRLMVGMGVNQWLALLIAVSAVLALAYAICRFAEPAIRAKMRDALDWIEARAIALLAQKPTAA